MKKLNAKQLRVSEPTEEEIKNIKRNPIYFVLDRIIDTYNIGSLFRLADAVAAQKMYLCGEMEYPPNSRIHKAAVGTENWVPWEKSNSTIETIRNLKAKGTQTIAIEQHSKSIAYTELRGASSAYSLLPSALSSPVAIIIGNETGGIEQQVLDEVDLIVELPMHGVNISMNTWGCAAVVAYKILEQII